jgi:hypothetical protein
VTGAAGLDGSDRGSPRAGPRARARPGEDWVHQWNANRTWMVHQWNSNGTWIPEITVLVEANRVPFLLLFHMQCQSNHPLYLLCHSSPSSDTVPLQLADCSCSVGQIALACKATPPSFALAEHCDPVLVQASYQASWDHDACRLRSLPAIPDWATSRFEPKPHPVLSQSQNPGNGSPRRGDKGTWVVEGQLPWHSHGLRAVHKTVFVNGANKYL